MRPSSADNSRPAVVVARHSSSHLLLLLCDPHLCLQPLPKLDMIAIPDFAAGAMENCECDMTNERPALCPFARLTPPTLSQAHPLTFAPPRCCCRLFPSSGGLITYREAALLLDPAHSSAQTKQWVAVCVAHEVRRRRCPTRGDGGDSE